jgi:hypothetical protein
MTVMSYRDISVLSDMSRPMRVHAFPARYVAWMARGLSSRATGALASAGCDSAAEVSRLGRGPPSPADPPVERHPSPNCPKLETGRRSRDAIAAALAMAIPDPEEAKEAATDAVIALRRSGYTLSARRTERPA